MESAHNQTISSIPGDTDNHETSIEVTEYEDPPGSVIDLRHVSRSSMPSKLAPRIHRRSHREKMTGIQLEIQLTIKIEVSWV